MAVYTLHMNPQIMEELRLIDEKAAETNLEVLRTQAEMSEKMGANFQGWVNSLSAISVTIGSAIIPLSLVASGDHTIPSTTTLGALTLIVLGAYIQFKMKHNLEKSALQIQILGWRHKAVIAERRGSYRKLLDQKISFEDHTANLLKGDAELRTDSDIKAPSRRPSIETDVYLLLFLSSLGFIAQSYVPNAWQNLSWMAMIGFWIVYGIYVIYLVVRVMLNNRKIIAYEKRISDSEMTAS